MPRDRSFRGEPSDYLAVDRVTASSPEPGWIRLQVRVPNTLAVPTMALAAVHNGVDLETVPVWVTEDVDVWRWTLYTHILIAAATGSGNGGTEMQLPRL
ncbi:hypothetical protein OHB12_01020 [Nocardia sp. NBC_01730]|uniref:hypothetical protein n=1 Tax=Nocardia sp. NBC_01730 TaxID=2975998 RepID=UPI002E122A02|nr:hypothetical protein OHB12_01020 [Nocardia sp. NBC_01730]